MNPQQLTQVTEFEWRIEPHGDMRAPGIIYASRDLIAAMDDKVAEQLSNVARLPGIQRAAYAMPDAHWGYGFPIGGVAAFDPAEGGIISAGGVGFDISCGVRALHTGLDAAAVEGRKADLAEALFRAVPAGVGSHGHIRLDDDAMNAMLAGGAQWAVARGYGVPEDLERIEDHGAAPGAHPESVSTEARHRQADEMGTLGSGNHYLEVQRVTELVDAAAASAFGLKLNDVIISIHCGSRGLGHQIGSEFLKTMVEQGYRPIPDRELACAPIQSPLGERYLGAMRAAINCALANRQIFTALVRQAVAEVFPEAVLPLLYDVSHNTCKVERHRREGEERELFVHRKGATRSLGPHHPDLPPALAETGQPVLIGGTMGTASWILAGTGESDVRAFSSACHGAGRAMSRTQATRHWQGRKLIDDLKAQGVLIRSRSWRGVAEEAPGAYKDVDAVAESSERAGLARRVARLEPMACVKG